MLIEDLSVDCFSLSVYKVIYLTSKEGAVVAVVDGMPEIPTLVDIPDWYFREDELSLYDVFDLYEV